MVGAAFNREVARRGKNPEKITYLYILRDEIHIYVIIELNNKIVPGSELCDNMLVLFK